MQLSFTPQIACFYCQTVFQLPEGAPFDVVCAACQGRREGELAARQELCQVPEVPLPPEDADGGELLGELLGQLVTVEQLVEGTPFTTGQLRKLLFDREENGLNVAVVKVGTRLYVHLARFERWLEDRFEGDG